MTRTDYLNAFLSLIKDEGPYNIVEFTLEDDDMYWLTLQLPEPYDGFRGKNLLVALRFESVDFVNRTVRFVIDYEDLVQLVEKTKMWLRKETSPKFTS